MKPECTGWYTSRGVTLVEMVMTIVILSIALVATIMVISSSVNRSANPLIQHKSVLLAQAYFDEILTKRFAEQTPVGGVPAATTGVCTTGVDPGESRDLFDDVDDYDLLNEMPPKLQTNVNLNDYSEYRVQVMVACAGTSLGLANNHDAKIITVTIDPPEVSTMTFTAYRANY